MSSTAISVAVGGASAARSLRLQVGLHGIQLRALDEGGHGTALERVGDKAVAVERGPLERNEDAPGRERARIGADRGDEEGASCRPSRRPASRAQAAGLPPVAPAMASSETGSITAS